MVAGRAVPNLWLIFAIAAVVVVLAVVSSVVDARRRKELAAFAGRLGFQFIQGARGSGEEFDAYTPFGQGSSRRVFNVIEGSRGGVAWQLFDYQFTTGSGKNRTTHRYGVVAARVALSFPRLTMRPEAFLDKVAAMAGFDDINFESEEFSRRYYVKCIDRRRCYDLIDARMIEYLLTLPAAHWQLGPGLVLIVRQGRFNPPELERTMAMITGLLERVPEHVRQDLAV